MTKKATKRALLSSALALVVCISMLIGTTYAWFTDSVVSNNNIITSGNLDVELEYATVVDGQITAWNKVQSADKIFNPDALWEPGRVEVVYLKVSNLGSLALKYQLGVNVVSEIAGENVAGEEFKLSDSLVFKVVEMNDALTTYTDREAVQTVAGVEKGLKDYNGKTTALEVGGNDYVALIVYMPETVGNEANYRGDAIPTINLGINLFATQVEAESDSFGTDYDKDAWNDGFKVYSADDLQDAIDNGKDVVLMNNIEGAINITEDVAINLNGNTFTGTILAPDANITLANGKIANDNRSASAIEIKSGSLVIEDVEIESARHALRIDGPVDVTINNGTFKTVPVSGQTQHALNISGGATVTINGGTFIGPKGTASDSGSAVAAKNSDVKIYGGNFSGGKTKTISGSITVYGGTFDQDPSAYVATGYKAINNNGKFYVVSETTSAVVSTPAEIKTALSDAAAAGSGDSIVYLAGDIDMTDEAWTPIKVDGYNGAGVVTIEGNGATIKGLNAPLFAGGFAGKSGIVIKNLTIADSTIVSTSGLGGGAFIDTADSMQVVTLENCHLINSTVSGERAGGLIGWCSGYAKLNDGPVKTYVTISDCSVVDSTIIGNGSAGGIAGHPGASDYTYTTIEDCAVKGVKVISYEPISSWRTGAIVGTANNGHVVINNVAVENVTLTQDGVTSEETKLYGRFVPSGTGTLVIDGANVVDSAAALATALTADEKEISVMLAKDIDLPISTLGTMTGGSGEYKLGGEATESITIDLNGKKLNITTTYWSVLGAKNANAIFTIKNGTMTSSQATGTWNSYDLEFANCNYVIENVNFEKAIAFTNANKTVNIKNVTIKETHDYYAMWISAKGQTVEIDNLTVISNGRGIKIDEQYVDAPAKVTLNIKDSKFTTKKKAAILVKSVAGAAITVENFDISNVSADSVNAVWVDSDAAASADKVTVNGNAAVVEQ